MRRLAQWAALLLTALALVACGSTEKKSEGAKESDFEQAADRTTCVADATKVTSYPAGFPEAFPFPDQTVVYDAEDRGADGVVVTGITSLPFKQVLQAMNGTAQDAGFKIASGETEEHDAEANWTGQGFRGRWAIRESGSCDGETVVQVLARSD